jgi:hypothetical protein
MATADVAARVHNATQLPGVLAEDIAAFAHDPCVERAEQERRRAKRIFWATWATLGCLGTGVLVVVWLGGGLALLAGLVLCCACAN